MDIVKAAAAAAVTFLVLDVAWLGVLMGGFYRSQLAPIALLSDDGFAPLWVPAALVYVLLSVGVAVFVTPRAETLLGAAGMGALFGLMAFGVYDLTNYATLAAWPLVVTLVDMAWGSFACATAAAAAHLALR